ncbi:hypothetical protein B0H10DRAFT_256169 [Mycena sp. CBHHK59/15]|nr:hypothetical protein B0H10DRAFT_256169 [Mycena sp. CBHHK59/15]
MSVLVDGVRTSAVTVSALLPQTVLSSHFISSHLCLRNPSCVIVAVDCGTIESFSLTLACTVSSDLDADVCLGLDWMTCTRKWYLDHGFGLPAGAFDLHDLLHAVPLASLASSALVAFTSSSSLLHPMLDSSFMALPARFDYPVFNGFPNAIPPASSVTPGGGNTDFGAFPVPRNEALAPHSSDVFAHHRTHAYD